MLCRLRTCKVMPPWVGRTEPGPEAGQELVERGDRRAADGLWKPPTGRPQGVLPSWGSRNVAEVPMLQKRNCSAMGPRVKSNLPLDRGPGAGVSGSRAAIGYRRARHGPGGGFKTWIRGPSREVEGGVVVGLRRARSRQTPPHSVYPHSTAPPRKGPRPHG
jgi:hypothetical protein